MPAMPGPLPFRAPGGKPPEPPERGFFHMRRAWTLCAIDSTQAARVAKARFVQGENNMNRSFAAALAVCGLTAGAALAQPAPGPRKTPAVLTHPGITSCATIADFLAYVDLPCGESGGLPLPPASADQLEKNKELVLRFYAGDRDVLADNFIQHDPAEPSTRQGWSNFMKYRMGAKDTAYGPTLGGKMGYGTTPEDADGKDINYLVAEGDMVVAIRFRWFPWPNGPEPIYKGIFVDVWRVKDGKLAEQWCSATPGDASMSAINRAKQNGDWVKFKNMNEQ